MENCQKKFSKVVIRKILVIFVATKPRWRNGRRARFRCECREACRFESYSGHFKEEFRFETPPFVYPNRTRSVGGGVAELSALGVYEIVIVATQRR